MAKSKKAENNINARIYDLLEEGATKKVITAHLTIEGYSDKQIKDAMEECGVGRAKAKTFASAYYEFLSSEKRIKQEAESFIMGLGEYGETSANVKRNLSHYLAIWELANRVWESK